MKKNRIIICVCLALTIIGISPKVEAASNASMNFQPYNFTGGSSFPSGITFRSCGYGSSNRAELDCPSGQGTGSYKIHNQFIKMGGKTFKAWCIDPALHASNGSEYTCTPYNDPGLEYLFEYAAQFQDANGQMDSAEHEMLMTLAFRFYSIYMDVGMDAVDKNGNVVEHDSLTGAKAALIRYLQYRGNDAKILELFSSGDASQFLSGNDAIINEAYDLAYEARLKGIASSEDLGAERKIEYNKISYDETKVVFSATSTFYIDPSKIQFMCSEGADRGSCNRVEYTWNGTSGTITVYTDCLAKEKSEFGFIARFNQNGVYACYGGAGNQLVVTLINDPTATDIPHTDFNPACGSPDCCTTDPINPGEIQGAVANCCVETTHSYAKDYDLDELFCYHDGLKVDKYWEKCDADYYINDDFELNEYCDLYCTERVSIDVPGAITAKSGRYFTLSKNPVGNTTSPYIEGYKRCRVRVKYDQWERDYIQVVREQVKAYNEYQKNMAFTESYNNLIKDEQKDTSFTATLKCSASGTAPNCKDSGGGKDPVTGLPIPVIPNSTGGGNATATMSDQTCTIKYTKHPIKSSQLESYYYSRIFNDNNSDTNPVVNNHNSVQLNRYYGGRASWAEGMPTDYVATDLDLSDCNTKKATSEATKVTPTTSDGCAAPETTYSCTIEYSELSNHERDLEALKKPYSDAAAEFKSRLARQAANAKTLESQLSQCNNFFNSEDGKAASMYNFDPSMSFRYSQIYRDDNGRSVLDEITIPFMDTPGCKIEGPETGEMNYEGGMDIASPRYSSIYGSGQMNATDFSGNNLKLDRSLSDFNAMLDATYAASKVFTHDARYKAVCEWEEEENNLNTLVPNGAVTETAESNFTLHEREYRVYLTTYDGTFETDWSITNVGEKGKFDKYLQQNGSSTCSGNSASAEDTFSCTLHIEYEIVYTGKCNGPTKNPDDCDPKPEVNGLFQFKVADPDNLFPTGTTTSDGKEIAKNWTDSSKGIAAKDEIEENGARGTTYAEERATYKFHLTPAVMRHIKNYNVTRNSNQRGGYSDFNMVCDCPAEAQTNTAEGGGIGCTKCKSVLLDDLEDGRIRYDGQTHIVSVWTANKSIDQVRNATWR